MSTVTSQAPSTISPSTPPPGLDLEPDDEWKENLRVRIEEGLKSMVADTKERLESELRKKPVSADEREHLTREFRESMNNIRKLASEGFQVELERERQERRWASGQAMLPQWSQALKEEQQDIMDRIKKSSSSTRPAAPLSDANPPTTVPKPITREIITPVSYPIPELPAELQKGREEKERRERERERERERDRDRDRAPLPAHSARRGSDTHVSEYSQTFRHATYNLLPERLHSDPVLSAELTDEPEELLRLPERYRSSSDRPPVHDRAAEAPVSRSMERQPRSLSDRHAAHSPPKPIPEVWKPAITPEDDARMSKPFPLGRRGSTASIRSTGSGGIRPSIAEAIPERADDMMEIAERRERERVRDAEQEWAPIDKARERERPISARNEGRQSAASDHSQRYDDPAVYGRASARPPDHHGGSYGPHPRPVRHQTSFSTEEREYGPYGPPPAPQRPIVPRTSFNDDRPYIMGMGPYPAPSPARPISHKQSFTDDHDRYYDPPPSRPYPTPPSSASRAVSRDYGHQDSYDPRGDSSYRDREPRSNTWKVAQQLPDSPSLYRRSSESRPLGREPSFSRARPDPEDPYSAYEYAPPTSSIPISRSRQSPISDETGQSWKGWAEQPPARPRDYRYELEYQRPPYSPDGGRPTGPRSPPSSYQGHRDATYHTFGGRSMHDEHEQYFENDGGSVRYYRETRTEPRRKEESRRDAVEPQQQEDELADSDAERDVGSDAEFESEAQAREAKRREEEIAKMEEEAKRKEEEAERKAEEAKRKEEETRRKEEEMKRKEDEARKKAEEAERRAAEARKKEADAKKKEEEARRKEEEARRKEEEARRKEEEARRKEAEAERKEAETRKKEKEIKKKEQEVKRKEMEARRMENEVKQKEEETRRREADAQRKEAEARKKEEDARKREAAATRKTAEAAQKEKETQKKEDEIRQREEELKRREDELARREEESNRKETERKQREEEASIREAQRLQAVFDEEAKVKAAERRREEERERREYEIRREEERRRAEDEKQKMQQQEEFRRREEEIRRRADERKRQDSVGADSAWVPQSSQQQRGPQRNGAGSSPSTERNGTSASSWGSGSSTAWSSTKTSTASSSIPPARPASSAPPPPTSKPRAGSMGSSFPTNPSPHPPANAISEEEEWQNRQNDYSWRQQEKFREEQAAMEAARLKMGKGKILSKEDVIKVFVRHEQQWESLKVSSELRWRNFPWPMMQPPSTPEDITYSLIDAYIQSPHYPDGDKQRMPKDRIKEHLRNWHPDRFETKYLSKVIDEEKAIVKEGAGSVVRTLNELLQRMNTSTPGVRMWD